MSDEREEVFPSLDSMAYDVAYLFRTTEPGDDSLDTRNGEMLFNLIRGVVRDELARAQQMAEAAHKAAVQATWDSPEFKAQVDVLREGRPVLKFSRCPSVGQLGYQCTLPTDHPGEHRAEWTLWS